MWNAEDLYNEILKELDLSREVNDEELMELIHYILDCKGKESFISLKEKTRLGKELFHAFRKLDILQELIEDDSITEIMINGTQNIFVEKEGKISQLEKRFATKEKLQNVIQQIVAGANRIVNESTPIVDARLSDGSRVNVVLSPVALDGPIVTIRKFPKEGMTMERLIQMNSISQEMVDFLKKLIRSRYNIFVSGGTGSGKTTFLNAMSQYIPKEERVITIEDNAELRFNEIPNLVRLEERNANVEGKGRISMRDLIRTALRMRPSRIIVGEVRGEETIDMLQALNTGHCGASSGHANSPRDMIVRLETMALMGMDLPLQAIQRQIASGIDIIIHLGRLRDSSRKVLEIVEVLGYEQGQIQLQSLYLYVESGMENGMIKGEWRKQHELQNKTKLLAAGYHKI